MAYGLGDEMNLRTRVNWSREGLLELSHRVKIAEEIAQKSKLTKIDVGELSGKIKEEMAKLHSLR